MRKLLPLVSLFKLVIRHEQSPVFHESFAILVCVFRLIDFILVSLKEVFLFFVNSLVFKDVFVRLNVIFKRFASSCKCH